MTEPGTLVAGRYRLVERIGAGAMGLVWRAADERLGRVVALKQLTVSAPVGGPSAELASQRMMREGRIAARLHHPNAISVFDVVDHGGTPWLVMEYLPSRSLGAVLTERGALPPREVAAIGRQLAEALAAAHAAGVVHRDVKPGNVLLGEGGVAKLTDFGISRATGDVTVTRTGVLAGTPAYLAPEVARGAEPAPASDVFALGATLYTAAEGQPPFGTGDNALALLHQVAGGQVLPPRRAGPLTPLLLWLLRSDPAQRPTMAQAAAALSALADGHVPPLLDAGAFASAFASSEVPAGAPAAGYASHTVVDLPAFGPEPDERPEGSDRRPALLIAAGVALAVLAGLLVLAATTGPPRPAAQAPPSAEETTEPAATLTTTTTAPPTTTPAPVSAAELQRVVMEYYALLPRDTREAWARLGPSLQAKGYDSYHDFWSAFDSVQAVPASVDPTTMTVRVLVVYRRDGRRPQAEVHDLVVIRSGDALLIDQDSKVGATAVPTTTRKRRG